MTELQRYLAEEVAEDHADGIITRREAMRRLGLLGVTGAAATSLLAASSGGAEAARAREVSGRARGAPRGAREVAWAPVATESITFPGPRVPLLAAWAPAERPHGGLLVIHENRGLNEHIRTVAGRFAASGYSALAIDLLSEEGGTGAFPGEAEVAAALAQIPPERHEADMKAGVTELKRRVPRKRVAAIGFCFGGAMVWRLLTSGERRLAAAAPFYGPFPEGGTLERSNTAVLGIYGGLDSRVNATRPAALAAVEAARLEHQFVTFTEADHAFFNDTGARFNPHAAAEAYHRVFNWFDRFVAGNGEGRDDD
jgi:carboxymethylenebutenolidase